MVRGLIGGGTDYSHQSLDDIIHDLREERENTAHFLDAINKNIHKAKAQSYWEETVPGNFRAVVAYSVRFYGTTLNELADIASEISTSVKLHHVSRLKKIADVAGEINRDIGRIWGKDYPNKDYENTQFRIVEQIYCDTRDMAVNLLDIDNMAHRLQDYVGREAPLTRGTNNPWISGSFYIVTLLVALVFLAVIFSLVPWPTIPVVLIGGLFMVIVIGLLQLRNDDKISDKTFRETIMQVVNQLPILRSLGKRKNGMTSEQNGSEPDIPRG